jgi:hypothetical protein
MATQIWHLFQTDLEGSGDYVFYSNAADRDTRRILHCRDQEKLVLVICSPKKLTAWKRL